MGDVPQEVREAPMSDHERFIAAVAYDCGYQAGLAAGKRAGMGYNYDDENDPMRSSNGDDDGREYWRSLVKAAIRAVLEGVEPVAWLCSRPNGPIEFRLCSSSPDPVPDGWTETPLYSLEALKEALK